MNTKLIGLVMSLHILFIIAGYFVLNYAVFLLLSQTAIINIIGYAFLMLFLSICVLIHYLIFNIFGGRVTTYKKWIMSVGSMCFSTFVAFLFVAYFF